MESRIEKELRGRRVEEVTKLNLSNCKCSEIAGLTDDYKSLVSLNLVNAGLSTLKGFPKLQNLKRLDLADNKLSGGLEALQHCPKLNYLVLSGNHIKDIESLQPLKCLKELRSLDLFNCEISNTEGYKEKVFELLEGLLYLDGYDKNGEEADLQDGEEDISDEDDDDEEDDEEDEVGLEYLQKQGLEDESEGEEFAPGDEDNEDDEVDDDSEEDTGRGVKRKHDDDQDEESGQ